MALKTKDDPFALPKAGCLWFPVLLLCLFIWLWIMSTSVGKKINEDVYNDMEKAYEKHF